MNDQYLQRFSRHILLDEIGIEGQERIAAAKITIIGVGGLGSPAALYLAAAGVGQLTLVDNDLVDRSNLQRQILHSASRIGIPKVLSAQTMLVESHPDVTVEPIQTRLDETNISSILTNSHIVLDCSDNFQTRHLVNQTCLKLGIPLISGSAVQFSGQIAVFDFRDKVSACYHCLFPDGEDIVETRCALTGIFSPVTGIIGTLQAAAALKFAGNFGHILTNKLLCFDALHTKFKTIGFSRDPYCTVCSSR